MSTFTMTDIPESELPAILADLAKQPQFEVVEKKKQANGLITLVVRKKPEPVGGASGSGASGSAGSTATGEIVGVTGSIVRLPSGPFRRPNGPVVVALQMALAKAGQAVEPDGDFGSITTGALRRWQSAHGFPETDAIDAKQWKALTGQPAPTLFDICLNVVADFEGTRFDRVVGNFDGAGVTFGLIGFTLVNGEIRKLLSAIETARPGVVANAFGALHPELMSVLSAPKSSQLSWADGISLGPQKVEVAKPWREAFLRIGSLPEARRAQIERANAVYWKLVKEHIQSFMPNKPLSDQDAGFWFDVAVQNALADSERTALRSIGSGNDTGEKLRSAFAKVISDGSAPKWRKDVLARKMTYAEGRGVVHGSEYRLSDWGLTGASITIDQLDSPSSIVQILSASASAPHETSLEPDDEAGEAGTVAGPTVIPIPSSNLLVPATSPHAAWPLYEKFVGFVASLGLRHFVADELLTLGGQNAAGSCKGLNEYPPELLWSNISPTAAVLDKLRVELAAPIHFLSAYRSPEYNRCIAGSAANSFHMRYQAIDFVCDAGTPSTWAAKLREYRNRGVFLGGIGVYRSFVHVDTRGVNRDWTG